MSREEREHIIYRISLWSMTLDRPERRPDRDRERQLTLDLREAIEWIERSLEANS